MVPGQVAVRPPSASHAAPGAAHFALAAGGEWVGDRSLKEIVDSAIADAERRAICRALALARGNKSHAARLLRTNYTTLHGKMKRFGISAREFRSA